MRTWLIDLAVAAVVALAIALALSACATPTPTYLCVGEQLEDGRPAMLCLPLKGMTP